jgi:hypothetical protein
VRHDLEERLREVADALFQQAIAAMRIRTRRAWTSQEEVEIDQPSRGECGPDT